jgi:predicted GTPase
MAREKIVIIGAAGRDFHNFNCVFRDNEAYEVVAFTASQIPDIEGRIYPAALAGSLYPDGIPIENEAELPRLIAEHEVACCVFSYSDVSHEHVMHLGSVVNAAGADFKMLGERLTQLESSKPVISICAVRTGSGKSQTTRRVSRILRQAGKKVATVRHPMPYGDLVSQRVQRFATLDDLQKHNCTIEEMEEYEPHIRAGCVVYAGVDYAAILREAEQEADIVLWDGGNNDTPFFKTDFHIVVADPHRAGHETTYYPGETNLRLADAVIINKVVEAEYDDILAVRENVRSRNPRCAIIDGASPLTVDHADRIKDRRVLCIEDGPTLTHGGMKYGAAVIAALRHGAKEIVDPRPWVTGKIAETFQDYPEIGALLPAMGYGEQQMADLQQTIAAVECDTVIVGTPIDLARIIPIKQDTVRVGYELQEIGEPNLEQLLNRFVS